MKREITSSFRPSPFSSCGGDDDDDDGDGGGDA
jgi:hypothetical protein